MNEYDQRRLKESPQIEPFYNDIPAKIAESAYYNLSHSPERASSLIRSEYANTLICDKENLKKTVEVALSKGATVDNYWKQILDVWFCGYRLAMKNSYIKYLESLSRTASWFITGSSNFPTTRNEKRRRTSDLRYEEIKKIREKMLDSFIKTVLPHGDGSAIFSDDPKATEKILKKISLLEKSLDRMKLANLICRKHQKIKFDVGLCAAEISKKVGLKLEDAILLLKPSISGNIKPFDSYSISNANIEIKRLKKRLEDLEIIDDKKINIKKDFGNGISIDLTEDSKIIISFPDRPTTGIIDSLKNNGFKWSRYRVAWVRKCTLNAIKDLEKISKFLEKVEF